MDKYKILWLGGEIVQKIDSIELYENDIEMLIDEFKDTYQIDNIQTMPQNTWNALLKYIYKHTFKLDNSILKDNSNNYNIEMCMYVCELYVQYCSLYDKEVSILGYSNLTGISETMIYEWGSSNNIYNNGKRKLSSRGLEIYKMLSSSREESLKNMLINGKRNPVGILGILNHSYQWNMPGVTHEKAQTVRLERADVVQIAQSEPVIALPGETAKGE